MTPELPRGARFGAALAAVYAGQLARVRVARGPLLFVATLQSLGLLVLLRGVVSPGDLAERRQVVAGATVLVVAFVALNLLAQRFGQLRAGGGLDYYAATGTPPAAVVLGTAASYATFALPGTLLVGASGALLYDLPLDRVWVVLPVGVAAGAALAGLGATLGLLPARPELAAIAGQLGMTAVLFLGFVLPSRLPAPLRAPRALVPSTHAVDALREAFAPDPSWSLVAGRCGAAVAAGAVLLAVATAAFRRAVGR